MNTTRYVLLGVMVMTVLATVASGQTFYSQTVSNDQPVLYWNFDEGGGSALQVMPVPASPTTDNDLAPIGSATWITHAAAGSGLLLGSAADLDGGGRFQTLTPPNSGKTNLVGPFALEMWLQVKPQAPGARNDYVMSFGSRGELGVAYDWDPDLLGLYGELAGQSNVTLSDQDTNWHHVVWIYYGGLRASGKVDAYLDGVAFTNLPPYDEPLVLNREITVGDYSTAGGLGFNGRIDEVAIYDWAGYTNSTAGDIEAKAASLVSAHQLAKTVDPTGTNLVITVQPTNTTGNIGAATNFYVAATASGPVSYQWQRNWVDIPNATNASYTTPSVTIADAGTIFRVRVSSGNVFRYSQEAVLNTALFITISPQPTNRYVNIGDTATFYSGANSTPVAALSYQWRKNGVNIPNATNTSYTTPVLKLSDTGTNQFQLRVNSGAVVKDSVVALLVVSNPPPPNTAYSQVVTNDAPLAYWNFDEPNGNALQLMPLQGPTPDNDFRPAFQATRVQHSAIGSGLSLGHAADLDGFSNFNIPAPNLNGLPSLAGAYAIEYWIQSLEGVGNNNDFILSFRGNGGLAIVYDWSDGPDYLELYGGNQTERTQTNGVFLASGVDTGWHHVVWVYYGGLRPQNKVDAYRDGVRIANIPCPYDQELFLLGPITFGDYTPAGGLGLKGRLDELALYDLGSFNDETALANYMNSLVARHLAAAQPPTLTITRNGNQATISWSGTGFMLQQKDNLLTPGWSDVSGGGTSPVVINIGAGNKFYSLRKL